MPQITAQNLHMAREAVRLISSPIQGMPVGLDSVADDDDTVIIGPYAITFWADGQWAVTQSHIRQSPTDPTIMRTVIRPLGTAQNLPDALAKLHGRVEQESYSESVRVLPFLLDAV